MLELVVAYLISGAAFHFAGKAVAEGALQKAGENLMGYVLKKYKTTIGKKFEEAKDEPQKADVGELVKGLSVRAEDDEELKRLIDSLGTLLTESGARVDNRKIVMGNDDSINQT